MKNKNCLVVFAKYPSAGKVKTRLGAKIGNVKAKVLYEMMLIETLSKVNSSKYDIIIGYTPSTNKKYFENFKKTLMSQPDVDLGLRMLYFFRKLLKKYSKVVIIGTDCPKMDSKFVLSGFSRLDNADIVLGPSYDGGYYLIGMSSVFDIFTGVEWSKSDVLSKSVDKISELGLKLELLEKLHDVDTFSELKHLNKNIIKRLGLKL